MLRGDLPPATVRVFLIRRKPDEEIADAQDTRRFTSFCGGSVDPPDFSQPVDWAGDPSGLSRARSQCRCALALAGDAHGHGAGAVALSADRAGRLAAGDNTELGRHPSRTQ